ncbi:MAG: ATP-binding cassette domain-containing protein [Peptococcaceae bacterium]|nr:ATP-binding cassette domain-containing protein [Peptococcaceae bacterium]
MSVFQVENLTYYYPESGRPALLVVNLTVREGEFLLVTGGSGSGKSSLARALAGLIPDFYGGRIGGRVFFEGKDIRTLERRALAGEVGIVFQDPEKQLVMTGVEAEVAFGLENLGLPRPEMFRRVAEVMSFLGLSPLKKEFTANLSGGQKQKLALASVLAMQPRVLILDEPTSQLDPSAAEELLNLVKRLNEEMNLTIILIEQRLERCFHLADRVAVMEGGRIVREGPPGEVAAWQVKKELPFVPPVAALFAHLGFPAAPLTVKEGRRLLKEYFYNREGREPAPPPAGQKEPAGAAGGRPVVEVNNLWFTYPNGREALRGISLTVNAGEFVAVLGENAAGKTTLLKHLAGLLKPGRGKVLVMGRDTGQTSPQQMARLVGYLSQNPNDYLFQDTVEEELKFTLANLGLPDDGRVDRLLERMGLAPCRLANPRDLSSGERQRVALASVLAAGPHLLVLDEPTRGIDYRLKAGLGKLLQELALAGIAVVLVTHDVEFAAEYAGRVVMLFDGQVACDGPKHPVLAGSLFYAPQVGRLFRNIDGGVLTFREAVEKLRLFHVQAAGCGEK